MRPGDQPATVQRAAAGCSVYQACDRPVRPVLLSSLPYAAPSWPLWLATAPSRRGVRRGRGAGRAVCTMRGSGRTMCGSGRGLRRGPGERARWCPPFGVDAVTGLSCALTQPGRTARRQGLGVAPGSIARPFPGRSTASPLNHHSSYTTRLPSLRPTTTGFLEGPYARR